MKKYIFKLIVIALISIFPVLVLLAYYRYEQRKLSYDFKRNIIYGVDGMRRFDLKLNSYYILNSVDGNIYLGNYTSSRHILKIDSILKDTQSVVVNLKKDDFNQNGYYKIVIDSPNFYMFNGIAPSILMGKLGEWKAKKSKIFTPYFQEGIPINKSSIAFKSVSSNTNSNNLRKESLSKKTLENNSILEKQVDGLFCTSGMLRYNKRLNSLIYLYYYRNQILLTDTNLNLTRKLKTIVPIDTAKFTVSTIRSNGKRVITSPVITVNSKCVTWDKYLFVESNIMGRNEDIKRFKSSTVIDIYNLENEKYLYSLYLPKQNEQSISDFSVTDGYIYTIGDHYINRYKVRFPKK